MRGREGACRGWDAKGVDRQGAGRTARRDGPAGPGIRTGAMRVCSILVETRNIPRPVSWLPDRRPSSCLPDGGFAVSGVSCEDELPGHSGGTAPDSHRLP
ncbi:hypothetical protein SCMC78_09380 [Streptomyces sp. CMC78]|uniref:Uncharacterized protein n=1 Tax=Streptomyces sp. CMC78 TaxID=3231512 RepID=A0AB33KAW1_9ACTN